MFNINRRPAETAFSYIGKIGL